MTVRFDDSLPVAADYIRQRFGDAAVAGCVFVRDASGRLSVLLGHEVTPEELASASEELCGKLGGYARGPATIRDITFPGVPVIFEENKSVLSVALGEYKVKLIDRRIVGADWTAPPVKATKKPLPRVVFASLKGGVGRSTALAVVSAHLSAGGKRVLAIDLDLEAPGIGSMLLRPEETPEFGVLDYLVENHISGTDPDFLQRCIGGSSLGSRGTRVDVMPALGSRTLANPENALAKLGRAYIDDFSAEGERVSFSEQVSRMIEANEITTRYDIVLIDARSGLHESNAAVLQNIDATVFLFATDQPQTYVGYGLLLAHLAAASKFGPTWFDRFQFVHAKSPNDEQQQGIADERLRLLITRSISGKKSAEGGEFQNLTATDFDLEWESDESGNLNGLESEELEATETLRVLADPRFEAFDPLSKSDLLTPQVYEGTFGPLLDFVDALLAQTEEEDLDG